jgi:hypothetical protein
MADEISLIVKRKWAKRKPLIVAQAIKGKSFLNFQRNK